MTERNVLYPVRCRMCKVLHTLKVTAESMEERNQGALIQVAFPFLDAGERELIISETCNTCFQNLFPKKRKQHTKENKMSSVNKVILVGRLGQDPEIKDVNNSKVCTFSIATNHKWTDDKGDKQEQVEWHKINAWGKLADNCYKYLEKGKQVYVEGPISTSCKEVGGVKKYYTSVRAAIVTFL